MKVLITSVGTATSVNLIRGLKKRDIFTFGTDLNDYGYTAGSLLADGYAQMPPASDPGYMEHLLRVLREEEIDLLIPVHDEELAVISRQKETLPCRCLIPDPETIALFRDKGQACDAVEKMGISVPGRLTADDLAVKRILKKRISVGSKGITVLKPGMPCGPFDPEKSILQQFVTGAEYTVDALCDGEGHPAYIVPRRRLEVKSGVATKVLVENNEGLIRLTQCILSQVRLPGFSNIQFIRDDQDVYWFIEVNPRFSGCGAATLAVCEGYLDRYLAFAEGGRYDGPLNPDVRWNAVVTRYYEEVAYHAAHL